MLSPLPIDPHLDTIVAGVRSHGAAVVVAAPGAGKTTRVPPALIDDGPLLLLQPRRLAARSLARRIAAERGWREGEDVGWQVRFERRFGPRTKLLVATEGILTARLRSDPLLGGFRTVVLDEFHERSLHGDLALAMLREVREARDDLRVVVMSATLDAGPVARFLGDAPVIDVPGREHPLTVEYAPRLDVAAACLAELRRDGGDVLCFLPGAAEIDRLARELAPRVGDVAVLPLHGSLDAAAQDAALAPSSGRKLVLATNLAETSLTVEGVTTVVDTGLHKVLRRDPSTGLDRLETERVSRDSADQRAGRAGRTGPGRALRLWDERDELREHREAEIRRVDLAAPLLEVFAWGTPPDRFRWYEAPEEEHRRPAEKLLAGLGAVAGGKITPLGRAMGRLPLHPRLARLLLGTGGTAAAAAACAALSEGRVRWQRDAATTRSDLWSLADRVRRGPGRLRQAARQLERLAAEAAQALDPSAGDPAEERERFLRAVLSAYPDRVARRREQGSPRLLLVGGGGAVLGDESGVRDAPWLVAVELTAGRRGAGSEARVRAASAVEREWLSPDRREKVHELDRATGKVRAFSRSYLGALVLSEAPAAADEEEAARLLRDGMLARGLGDAADAALRRIAFAGVDLDLEARLLEACRGRSGWFELDPVSALDWDERRQVDAGAPARLPVPSGRSVALEYRADGSVVAAVKLQELFGLAETPTVGSPPVAVTFSLLAPNGRPVQTTRDLRSFWETAYPEVRKQLRGRYPKHPWPEDPWTARPTARSKRRRE